MSGTRKRPWQHAPVLTFPVCNNNTLWSSRRVSCGALPFSDFMILCDDFFFFPVNKHARGERHWFWTWQYHSYQNKKVKITSQYKYFGIINENTLSFRSNTGVCCCWCEKVQQHWLFLFLGRLNLVKYTSVQCTFLINDLLNARFAFLTLSNLEKEGP